MDRSILLFLRDKLLLFPVIYLKKGMLLADSQQLSQKAKTFLLDMRMKLRQRTFDWSRLFVPGNLIHQYLIFKFRFCTCYEEEETPQHRVPTMFAIHDRCSMTT